MAGHAFRPDQISLVDSAFTSVDRILMSRQVTDTYLLSLSAALGGRLATLDRRLATEATVDGQRIVCLVS